MDSLNLSSRNVSTNSNTTGTLYASTTSTIRSSPRQSSSNNKKLTDKFRLGEELGRGAYGQVFKGMDIRTGEQAQLELCAGAVKLCTVLRRHSGLLKHLTQLPREWLAMVGGGGTFRAVAV